MRSTKQDIVVFFDLGSTLVVGSKWIDGAQHAIERLAARGVRLGILSNTGTLTRAKLAAELPADFHFNAFEDELVLLSSETGVEKPDPQAFVLAKGRAGPNARVLFCTEELGHCMVAQRAGLLAARVCPPPQSDIGDLPEVLEKAGVFDS